MSTFNRGLDKEFVAALNAEYEKGEDGWWSQFVDDEKLFCAIRENCLNVYYRGGSILKLERPYGRHFKGKIHHKYLQEKKPKRGCDVTLDECSLPRLNASELKHAVDGVCRDGKKGNAEKDDVHRILDANQTRILDVEIAFSFPGTRKRKQIDFSFLERTERGWHVTFFEAKVVTDDRLQSRNAPKVLDQMSVYEHLLEERHKALSKSYLTVARNLANIRGLAERYPKRHKALAAAVKSGRLTVETLPRLVITRTKDPRNRNWREHLYKLEQGLPGRVICLDDPKADSVLPALSDSRR